MSKCLCVRLLVVAVVFSLCASPTVTAGLVYDWVPTEGGDAGSIAFADDLVPGDTADSGTGIASLAFSNGTLPDWSIADMSWWNSLILATPDLVAPENGLALYLERGTLTGAYTLTFYYYDPANGERPEDTPDIEGWSWVSMVTGGGPEMPEIEGVEEYGPLGDGNELLTGSGKWVLEGGPEPAWVPAPASLLLALSGLSMMRAGMRRWDRSHG
jgi:hypothetical protein